MLGLHCMRDGLNKQPFHSPIEDGSCGDSWLQRLLLADCFQAMGLCGDKDGTVPGSVRPATRGAGHKHAVLDAANCNVRVIL